MENNKRDYLEKERKNVSIFNEIIRCLRLRLNYYVKKRPRVYKYACE